MMPIQYGDSYTLRNAIMHTGKCDHVQTGQEQYTFRIPCLISPIQANPLVCRNLLLPPDQTQQAMRSIFEELVRSIGMREGTVVPFRTDYHNEDGIMALTYFPENQYRNDVALFCGQVNFATKFTPEQIKEAVNFQQF